VLWNKSVPWILLPFALVYLANAGTSLAYYLRYLSLTYLALSIVVIYGNGWAHNDAFPTLTVTVVYNWMWLGSQFFRYHHSQPKDGISPRSITANIVLNASVVVRLLWMSRRAKQFVGSETSNQYISIAVLV
jgi:hypothetical protein